MPSLNIDTYILLLLVDGDKAFNTIFSLILIYFLIWCHMIACLLCRRQNGTIIKFIYGRLREVTAWIANGIDQDNRNSFKLNTVLSRYRRVLLATLFMDSFCIPCKWVSCLKLVCSQLFMGKCWSFSYDNSKGWLIIFIWMNEWIIPWCRWRDHNYCFL